MNDEIVFNENYLTHFNFNMTTFLSNKEKRKEIEKDLNKVINYLKDNNETHYFIQGQYLITGFKDIDNGDIQIYVTADYYSAIFYREYNHVDWKKEREKIENEER